VDGNSDLQQEAEAAFRAGLRKVDPRRLIESRVRLQGDELRLVDSEVDLSTVRRIFVVAFGKAAVRMTSAVEEILGDRIEGGVVLSNSFPEKLPPKYRGFECTHPLPSEANIRGGRAALKLAAAARESDLVLCLVSGGGSSILTVPAPGVALDDMREAMRQMLHAGAPIDKLNALRKHLSAVKGGRLAQAVAPAKCVSLILSDVPGDDLGVIASGPTVPDSTTFAHAWDAAVQLGVAESLPAAVAEHLRRGLEGMVEETPKPGDPVVERCTNVLIGSNRDMLAAMEEYLRRRGYWTLQEAGCFEGEARELGAASAKKTVELVLSLPESSRPYALIAGGESTVTVRGDGLGGRNCELALAAAIGLEGCDNCAILAAGTDGIDGPTDAAGATVSGDTIARASALRLDPVKSLENNDSYNFFKRLGGLIITGPTGTNLMDVTLTLIGK